jgi:hypothetical protein
MTTPAPASADVSPVVTRSPVQSSSAPASLRDG